MNGMIFAAGLGTRLRPLTDGCPKAMVRLNGCPLLQYIIEKMKQAGVDRLVVNVHHYAGQIEDFLLSNANFGMDIVVSDERDCLLDTGGGLLKARPFFKAGEPVLVHNVDILSDIDLAQLIRLHREYGHYATMVVNGDTAGRVLKFDRAGILRGWENKTTGEQKIVDKAFDTADEYSFCGIQVLSADFLKNIEYSGVFSIIDEYIFQARRHPVNMYLHQGLFRDLGTPEALLQAEQLITRLDPDVSV